MESPSGFSGFLHGRWPAAVLAALLSAQSLSAAEQRPEESPLASVETRMVPPAKLEDPPAGFDEEAAIRIGHLRAHLPLPWILRTDSLLLTTSFGYQHVSFHYENWNGALEPEGPLHFHAVSLGFFLRGDFEDERWSMTSFLTPGLNSDFEELSSRAFRLQGGLFFNRQFNWGKLSMGAVFINDYGSPRVFPALAYAGRLTDRQSLIVRLPVLLSWEFHFNKPFGAGLASRVAGNNFHVDGGGPFHKHTLRYSTTLFGPFLKWRPVPYLSFGFDTGVAFRHRLEYWDGGRKVKDLDLKPSMFLLLAARLVI